MFSFEQFSTDTIINFFGLIISVIDVILASVGLGILFKKKSERPDTSNRSRSLIPTEESGSYYAPVLAVFVVLLSVLNFIVCLCAIIMKSFTALMASFLILAVLVTILFLLILSPNEEDDE